MPDSDNSISSGTSVVIVTSRLDSSACSAYCSIRSFCFAFQLVGVLQQILDRAELGNQFLSRLFADTGNAGNVVAGIPHQSQDVNDLVDCVRFATSPRLRRRPAPRNFEPLSARFVDVDVRSVTNWVKSLSGVTIKV